MHPGLLQITGIGAYEGEGEDGAEVERRAESQCMGGDGIGEPRCGSGLCVVSGAPVAMEPSAAAAPPAPAPRGEDVGCFRPLLDVIWGFIVTQLACTVAVWGIFNHRFRDTGSKMQLVLFGVFVPIHGLHVYLDATLRNAWLLWNYHNSIQLCLQYHTTTVTSSKTSGRCCIHCQSSLADRILFTCDVVVYILKGLSLLEENWLWSSEGHVIDDSGHGDWRSGGWKNERW